MTDQYGNEIPNDLVCLPDINHLSDEDIKLVDNADWYEAKHDDVGEVLLVSGSGINWLEESTLEDATGIPHEWCEIARVDSCLHRFNSQDGFYHA